MKMKIKSVRKFIVHEAEVDGRNFYRFIEPGEDEPHWEQNSDIPLTETSQKQLEETFRYMEWQD